jgi:hypothetical protein
MSQIRMPSHASAPSEPNQVTQNKNLIDTDISLINFNATAPKLSYPALPEAQDKWILVTESNRIVLKCGDTYYCTTKRKCLTTSGDTARIAPPSQDLQKQLEKAGQPPQIPVTYGGTKDKPIIHWHFSDTDTREWRAPHWYSLQNKRFHYGYGHPKPTSTPAKN